jgi:hypothetical protein
MSDEAIVRLLEELRDLTREAGQRQERSLAIQEEAMASQRLAVETQRRALGRLVPLLVVVALVIIVPYLWNVAVSLLYR